MIRSRRNILKKLKKSAAMQEARQIDYNKDGDAIISVGLREADEFFSPYSYKTYELMNPEVIEYIDSLESEIPITDSISVDIHTEEPTNNIQKKRIRDAVKRQNAEQIIIVEKKLKRNLFSGLLSTILGVLVLILEAFLWKTISNYMLDTVLVVLGWMFLWDGIEILIFERPPLKRKQFKCYRLMNAKVHVRQYSNKIKKMYNIGGNDE